MRGAEEYERVFPGPAGAGRGPRGGANRGGALWPCPSDLRHRRSGCLRRRRVARRRFVAGGAGAVVSPLWRVLPPRSDRGARPWVRGGGRFASRPQPGRSVSAGAADLPLGAAARRVGVAAAGVALVAGALTLNRDLVGVFYDDGVYATIAWALAHGHGYVYANLPGAPAAIHYPPLYSTVLAPLFGFLSLAGAAPGGKLLTLVCAAAACGAGPRAATRRQRRQGTPVPSPQ